MSILIVCIIALPVLYCICEDWNSLIVPEDRDGL